MAFPASPYLASDAPDRNPMTASHERRRSSVGDVLRFLESAGLSPRPTAAMDLDASVGTVRPDQEAEQDSLSWISPKVVQRDAQRVSQFRGALLIVPADTPESAMHARAVRVANPKLAFSRVVYEFFSELTDTTWADVPDGIDPSSRVDGSARLAPGVVIGPGCTVGRDVSIGPNTVIARTEIGARTRIGANCTIGLPGFGYERGEDGQYVRFPHVGRVTIGEDVEIGSNTCVDRGALGATHIGNGCKIDNLVHVAHNVTIGENSLIIAHAMLGGSVDIGADAWIAPAAAIRNQLTIGPRAVVGMGAVVVKSVDEGITVAGNPAKPMQRS